MEKMSEESRNMSAFVISPYDHGDSCDAQDSIVFPNGKITEKFGELYEIEWFDYIRGKTPNRLLKQVKLHIINSLKTVGKQIIFLKQRSV